MNHLNTLLRDASTDAPPDHLDLDTVLGAARSRVRRRRAVTGVAVAAVAGLAAGLTLALPGGGDQPEPAPPGQVEVLTLSDAARAEAGRDYDVLARFTAHSTDEAMTGDFVRGVLPDGTVVTERYPNGVDGLREVALVAPGGETRTVGAPRDVGNYLGSSGPQIMFGSDTGSGMWLLDYPSLQWGQVFRGRMLDDNNPVQPVSQGIPSGAGPRGGQAPLTYRPAAASGAATRPIVELDMYRMTSAEVAEGGAVASSAGRAAWTDAYDAPVREVTVHAGDSTTAFDPGTGDCRAKGIGLTADRVVLMTNCDEAGGSEYTDVVTRVDVFELDGTPLTRFTDEGFGPVRMSDRFLTLTSWRGEQEGTYTYDLETGRFLRVTDAMSGLAGSETGAGRLVVWEEPLDGESGATYVVARMR
jgi:hypothetical protein